MPVLDESKDSITGGCLCGAVRYTIDFPVGSSWPPDVRYLVHYYSLPVTVAVLLFALPSDHLRPSCSLSPPQVCV